MRPSYRRPSLPAMTNPASAAASASSIGPIQMGTPFEVEAMRVGATVGRLRVGFGAGVICATACGENVGVKVRVGDGDDVGVSVGVDVGVWVSVGVGVEVSVGVGVSLGVGVGVGVAVRVGVGVGISSWPLRYAFAKSRVRFR